MLEDSLGYDWVLMTSFLWKRVINTYATSQLLSTFTNTRLLLAYDSNVNDFFLNTTEHQLNQWHLNVGKEFYEKGLTHFEAKWD